MKALLISMILLAGPVSFAAKDCTLPDGLVILHGQTGCSEGLKAECSNGKIAFSSDLKGKVIPCKENKN